MTKLAQSNTALLGMDRLHSCLHVVVLERPAGVCRGLLGQLYITDGLVPVVPPAPVAARGA